MGVRVTRRHSVESGVEGLRMIMVRLRILLGLILITSFAEAKTVSFIHSYHQEYLWVKEYRQGFFDYLAEGITVDEFEMDTKRRHSLEDLKVAQLSAIEYLKNSSSDLVILSDDNALNYLGRYVQANNIPLLFSGINANPRDYVDVNSLTSGVLERPLLRRSVSLIRKFAPSLKKVKVLMDDSPSSQAILSTSFGGRASQKIAGVVIDGVMLPSFEAWKSEVNTASTEGYDAILLLVYSRLDGEDGSGAVPVKDVDTWTSKHAGLPVFGTWEFSVGKGRTIGGFCLSGYEQGKALALQANRYFSSGKMPTIVTPEKGKFVFSRTELERWQIELPASIQNIAVYHE
ncbi:hypothetical protein [Vibrio sp. SCSIO 43136]|uniref:ABC transporter substrate-binding protein n=1 Tax=Vibrio sp. SCSIO 43136 TaxID=2819101 RepID=UPI002075A105|nr:hypothetical protein [Vibrio sp. SCSIO 43136]USD66480.1 hypothetical protein J4N39_06645 [Vibrio sp. SCSIO 43136]